MDYQLTNALTIIGSAIGTGLVIGVVQLFRDWRDGKPLFKKQPNEIYRLSSYYNHDLTEKLDRLIAMEEKEHESADSFRESQKDIARTLQEIQRYGIPCRKD